ncbi:hypothetical protein CANCADRAFT_81144 [Tortispora caseinolytica NRRL Y-17796]|uniref:ferric-chelate reductase (NADPH) n=1 Tax=Tortispora caseinolytica NRRL Y-17796 TaxID=767744 RepID=A0A1E4TJY1_9ASCO|nr:hypothetical protein CANCADRAFT_81144 [Tortispora caseinolytica NRRL Y-17796]
MTKDDMSMHLIILKQIGYPTGFSAKVLAEEDASFSNMQALGLSCMSLAAKYPYECNGADIFTCLCNAAPALGTIAYCIYDRQKAPIAADAWAQVQNTCTAFAKFHVTDNWRDIAKNASKMLIDPQHAPAGRFTQPVRIPDSVFVPTYYALSVFYYNKRITAIYTFITISFFFIVCGFAGILRLLNPVFCFYRRKSRKFRHYFARINAALILPAGLKGYHSRPFLIGKFLAMSTPLRYQVCILGVYCLLTAAFVAYPYKFYQNNPLFPRPQDQVIRYLGDRTGSLAFANIPPLIMFASRNNILSSVTGWTFETMNVYHRWASRMMILLATLHMLCFSYTERQKIRDQWKTPLYFGGIIAIHMCFVLLIHSLYKLRHRNYELFLGIHIAAALVFLVGCMYHSKDFPWIKFVYGSMALWALDRVLRVLHIVTAGGPKLANCVLVTPGIVKLTAKTNTKYQAGDYVYLYFLGRKFWQSHPFTVLNASSGRKEMEILIKAEKGMTSEVVEYTSERLMQRCDWPVWIEGPYGHHVDLKYHEKVLLIAGGVGISSIVPYALELKDLIKKNIGISVCIMWIVKDTSCLSWVSLCEFSESDIETHIRVTRKSVGDADMMWNESIVNEKPDIETFIEKEIEGYNDVGILVCGPASLNDAARSAVTYLQGKTDCFIGFHEESFSW